MIFTDFFTILAGTLEKTALVWKPIKSKCNLNQVTMGYIIHNNIRICNLKNYFTILKGNIVVLSRFLSILSAHQHIPIQF